MNLKVLSINEKSPKHQKNQDARLVSSVGGTTTLILADGHGGTSYVRSSMGARIACLAAKKAIESELTGESLKVAIKDNYDRICRKHIELRPFKEWELKKLGNRPDIIAYGTTLLLVVVHPFFTEYLQLGDGELHLLGADGRFLSSLPKDPDCIGNITSSLCYDREEAIRHMRSMAVNQQIAAAILFTDGYIHKTDRPYELAELLTTEEDISMLFAEALKKGIRGDDQTCTLAYNPAIVRSKEFQTGLARTIEEGKLAARRECLKYEITRLQREVDNVSAVINRFRGQDDSDKAFQLSLLLRPDIAALNSLKLEYSELTS